MLERAYARLRAEGCRSAVVQGLHLVPGKMHQSIHEVDPSGLKIALGGTLLETRADPGAIAAQLVVDLPRDRPVLVMAHKHGREAYPDVLMQLLATGLSSLHPNLAFGNPEEPADRSTVDSFIQLARTVGKAHVCPLFLVLGKRLKAEIQGDRLDSLRSLLAIEDFTCGPSMGSRSWVRARFLARIADAIAALQVPEPVIDSGNMVP